MWIFPITATVLTLIHMHGAAQQTSKQFNEEENTTQVLKAKKCRSGQFYSQDRGACLTCRKCDLFSVKVADCNATSNTVCVKCLSDTGDLNKVYKNPACRLCKPCGPGKYVSVQCNVQNKTKTKCSHCQTGSFKVMTSFSPFCVPCTECGNMHVIKQCTVTEDTSCGVCKPGHFRDRSRNICFPCRSCMPNETHMSDCQDNSNGKFCGGMFIRPPFKYQIIFAGKDNTSTAATSTQMSSIQPQQKDASARTRLLDDWALLIVVVSLSLILIVILIVCITILGFRLRKLGTPDVTAEPKTRPSENTFIVFHCNTSGESSVSRYFHEIQEKVNTKVLESDSVNTKSEKVLTDSKHYGNDFIVLEKHSNYRNVAN